MAKQIPDVVISRLPRYVRGLTQLQENGIEYVNSHDLGIRFGITSARIRKDLSYFGRLGTQGRGYNVNILLEELRQILGLERQWHMAVVGVGRLGKALMDYRGFVTRGFRIVAAFDQDTSIIGRKIGGVSITDIKDLKRVVVEENVDIGIVAVPASDCQEVINKLISSGVKSILNYAPICVQAPDGIHLQGIDPVLALQSMTYYLNRDSANRQQL